MQRIFLHKFENDWGAEIMTGDPRWYNFYWGYPAGLFFTGVEAGGPVGRDV